MASCLSNSSTLTLEPDPFAPIPSYLYSAMSGENQPEISSSAISIVSRVHKNSTGSISSAYSLSPPHETCIGSLEYIETLMASRNPESSGLLGSPGPFRSFGSPGPNGSFGSPGPNGSFGSPGPTGSSGSNGSVGSPRLFGGSPRPFGGSPRSFEGSPRPFEGSPRSFERSPRPFERSPRPFEGTPRPVEGSARPVEGSTRPFGGSSRPLGSLGSKGLSTSQGITVQKCKPPPGPKTTSLFCNTHRSPKGIFCSTCTVTVCQICADESHADHATKYVRDAIQTAQMTNYKLQAEIRMAMEAIKGSIARVQRRSEDIERNSIQAASSVITLINSHATVLKGRERRLLQTIDQNRHTKGRCLSQQKENLQAAFYSLKSTSDFLNEPMDHMNPVRFISANEQAKMQLRSILARVPELEPCEEDDIRFTPPQESDIFRVGNLGYLPRNNPKTNRELRQLAFREPFLCLSERKNSNVVLNKAIHGAPLVMVVMNPGRRPTAAFGRPGDGDGELCRPWGVCCDRYGNIIVADRSNNRIQVFDNEGHHICKFGGLGSGHGEFNKPAGITVNRIGHIVVADKDNHRIQIFTTDGTFVRTFGKFGKENGEFNYPWDVACNVKGEIVVSDTKNKRIQLFSETGVYLNKFSYEGTADTYLMNQLDSPRGVCFTPEGNILVTDFNNHRLAIINDNMLECRILGFQGNCDEGFDRPQGVVCDDEGQIIVADSKNNRIKVMDKGGNLRYICGYRNQNNSDLDTPSGICVNPQGHIVVVDFGNSQIKIY